MCWETCTESVTAMRTNTQNDDNPEYNSIQHNRDAPILKTHRYLCAETLMEENVTLNGHVNEIYNKKMLH